MRPYSSHGDSLFDQTNRLAMDSLANHQFPTFGQTIADTHQGIILHSGGHSPTDSSRLSHHNHIVKVQHSTIQRQLAHDLRIQANIWQANASMRAERAVMSQPLVASVPRSFGILNSNSLWTSRHLTFQNHRYASDSIEAIFDHVGGWQGYNRAVGQQGIYLPDVYGRSIDTSLKDVRQYNLSVNPKGQFQFNNIDISDRALINYLLGNMITGRGPENYVFPTDGVVSKRVAEGRTFTQALNKWYLLNNIVIP